MSFKNIKRKLTPDEEKKAIELDKEIKRLKEESKTKNSSKIGKLIRERVYLMYDLKRMD